MKILLTSYINRNFLLFCKMLATAIVSTIQSIVFLIVAYIYGIELSVSGILLAIPVILFASIILNAFALFLSSVIKQLENFAAIMNFVIFPMFFLSSALYPLWKVKDSSLFLYTVSSYNPFTYIVESIRFALYLKFDFLSFSAIAGSFIIALGLAFMGYKSKKVLKKN